MKKIILFLALLTFTQQTIAQPTEDGTELLRPANKTAKDPFLHDLDEKTNCVASFRKQPKAMKASMVCGALLLLTFAGTATQQIVYKTIHGHDYPCGYLCNYVNECSNFTTTPEGHIKFFAPHLARDPNNSSVFLETFVEHTCYLPKNADCNNYAPGTIAEGTVYNRTHNGLPVCEHGMTIDPALPHDDMPALVEVAHEDN